MKLSVKLIFTHLLVGIIAVMLSSYAIWWITAKDLKKVANEGTQALEKASFESLKGFRSIKKKQIEDFFKGCKDDLNALVYQVGIFRQEAIDKLHVNQAFKKQKIESYLFNLADSLKNIASKQDLKDLVNSLQAASDKNSGQKADSLKNISTYLESCYLTLNTIDAERSYLLGKNGEVLLINWGRTNINDKITKNVFSDLWRKIAEKKQLIIIDDKQYSFLDGKSVFFMACPIFSSSDQLIGAIVIPISQKKISSMIRIKASHKIKSFNYIFDSDLRMISPIQQDSAREISFNKLLKNKANLKKLYNQAKKGFSIDSISINDKKEEVLLSCMPLDLPGDKKWALISEANLEQILAPKIKNINGKESNIQEQTEFYKSLIDIYGYYDLFLFTPDGFCFYTVKHESDWKTNLLTGPYKESQLGNVVRQVLKNKRFSFADYKPYPPSNDSPAAFIAEPLIVDGDIELIVGLQLPAQRINNMVHLGSKKELHLESYLIGSDGFRRSNSFLEPDQTIEQSFSSGTPIDNVVVQSALKGQTGTDLTSNYSGKQVLSAYTPINIYGVKWALVCEQEKAVALAAKEKMQKTGEDANVEIFNWTVWICISVFIIVLLTAWLVARGISRPIMALTKIASSFDLVKGDAENSNKKIVAGGEIGILAERFDLMRESIQQQHKQLRENEENLRITLNSIGDGFIATDMSGAVTRMNHVAEKLTGWTFDEAQGKKLDEIFRIKNFNTGEEMKGPVDEVLKNGQIFKLKDATILVAKDETERLIDDSAAPIRSQKDKIHGVVLVFKDITSNHAMEEHLRQNQKMEAIGNLVGGITHDLNNMTGAIVMANELLGPYLEDDEEAKESHEMIKMAADHIQNLINKLLTFARKQPVKMDPVDLHVIIRDVISMLKKTIDKRIEISTEFDSKHSVINCDGSLMQSVLLNLGINASHAMPEGGNLTYSTNEIELDEFYCEASQFDLKTGKYLQIGVNDTGCGIPQKDIGKIFDPFYTTKDQGVGTGLGLSTSFGVIQQHNGAITVYSEEGRGTTFHILLPISDEVLKEKKVNRKAIKGTGNILLVDDEKVVMKSLSKMLERLGYNVITAEDGEEGLSIFKEKWEEIDLVILDMIMPKINGRDCFFKMKEINPHVKVILSSGFYHGKDVEEMMKNGLCSSISKPYDSISLSQKIHDVLNN